MSTLRGFIPILILLSNVAFSTAAISSSRFNGTNCNLWPFIEPDLSMEVYLDLSSILECASECVRKNCTAFQYLKQTSVCRISSFGISNETDGWYCSQVSNSGNLMTAQDNCTLPFKNYHSICISHIEQKFSSYYDMEKACTLIGGQLYKISLISTFREIYVMMYSIEYRLGMYAIQGQPGFIYGLTPSDWYNADGSKAAMSGYIQYETLVIDHGILTKSGVVASDVLGVICEQTPTAD